MWLPPSPPCKNKKPPSFGGFLFLRSRVCGRTHRVRQKSRSDFWTSRRSRGGPERSGGRAADPGREQSHPLRQIKRACLSGLFYLAVQDVWTNPPSSTKSRSNLGRRARGGPERSGGRAAVPGREQSHPLRQSLFREILLKAAEVRKTLENP